MDLAKRKEVQSEFGYTQGKGLVIPSFLVCITSDKNKLCRVRGKFNFRCQKVFIYLPSVKLQRVRASVIHCRYMIVNAYLLLKFYFTISSGAYG